eukprot:1220816-Ditylum_brightwellii.AAC.1
MVCKSPPKNKAMKKKAGLHQEGIFSPVVYLSKTIVGEDKLNKVQVKAISLDSNMIKSFDETANSSFCQHALVNLFQVADKHGNGKLDNNEIQEAPHTLGFSWLKEKQVEVILKQADQDENGVIVFQTDTNR